MFANSGGIYKGEFKGLENCLKSLFVCEVMASKDI